VPRFEYVLGKLAGVLVLLAISVAAMTLLSCAMLYVREQAAISDATQQMGQAPADQLQAAVAAIRKSTFTANLLPAVATIYLKAAIVAAVTLLISTIATSNIFTIVMAVFVYFIGHLQAIAREAWLQEQSGAWLSRGFLAVVALIFPDLQLFDFTDELVAGAAIPLGLLGKTFLLGGFYIVVYALLAIAVFNAREL
jgi:hypothetical protein